MKKVIIAMALLAIAVPAMAADIPDDSGGHSKVFGCGACHSAHVKVPIVNDGFNITDAGNITVPLWGRTITTETLSAYGAGTTTKQDIVPGTPQNESALCMSCHDGVTNAAGVGHGIDESAGADAAAKKALGYIDTNIGHPISFTYTGAVTVANFNVPPITSGTSTAVLENDRVECTSCHDVHGANINSDNYAIRATTKTTDSEEAICKSCHIK